MASDFVECPLCSQRVSYDEINQHIDNKCKVADVNSNNFDAAGLSTKINSNFQIAPLFESKRNPIIDVNAHNFTVEPQNGSNQISKRRKIKEPEPPLAEQARPKTLDDFVGQKHLLSKEDGILRKFMEKEMCPSMILWGPSGVGKTTLARLIAQKTKSHFDELSATSASVNDCKRIFQESRNFLRLTGKKTILFLDEIHRFNKAQQDIFLHSVEKGEIILIGATTENPSFKVNAALLSRCRVFVLQKLLLDEVFTILRRISQNLNDECLRYLAGLSDGDGRVAINLLELVLESGVDTMESIKVSLQRTHLLYDRLGDSHYDTISAFHKSVRGSDADAALFYLARMLEAGESPLYVARRMIRIASEDIGLADDSCLPFAVATYTAAEKIGMPEANVTLAHCAIKLANAPKSVKVYRAYNAAAKVLKENAVAATSNIPLHLRNAPTTLMKHLGHGQMYKYNPDYLGGQVNQDYLPVELQDRKFIGDLDLGLKVDHDL
ncbi:DNA polymerase III, clamp loader complex, gamma/delta/delta subunit [Lipomyces japonicus]|uniref:DNA polymerase III, clamp loader complex, gamma/delta/delta subunit n=1 Tax=Lipomyces japonicus TaxID=56871 RepID=UPI0034CD92C0